jgi:hypothetical protein
MKFTKRNEDDPNVVFVEGIKQKVYLLVVSKNPLLVVSKKGILVSISLRKRVLDWLRDIL